MAQWNPKTEYGLCQPGEVEDLPGTPFSNRLVQDNWIIIRPTEDFAIKLNSRMWLVSTVAGLSLWLVVRSCSYLYPVIWCDFEFILQEFPKRKAIFLSGLPSAVYNTVGPFSYYYFSRILIASCLGRENTDRVIYVVPHQSTCTCLLNIHFPIHSPD